MRVLQINAVLGYGSTGVIASDIGQEIEAAGGESFYAYQRASGSFENSYVIGNSRDWKIHALLSRALGRQGFFSCGATKKLIKHIKGIKPDIVHLHNLHNNYINIEMLLRFLAEEDIATVITLHDCWFFTGKCYHPIYADCQKFKSGCGSCPQKKAAPKSLFFDNSEKDLKIKCDLLHKIPRLKIVGCSDWICAEAKESLWGDLDVSRIYNGVDTEIFKIKPSEELKGTLEVDGKRVILGMANKWFDPKNCSFIERVAALPDTKLIIIGCSDEQKTYLRDCGAVGVGFIKERALLAEYYNIADVFVNLTYADTLPTVNMESICCGTPVVTFDSCGSPELIDGQTGAVVRSGDFDAVLAVIENNPGFDSTICENRGKEKFDKNICYKKYIDAYKEILG